ncbi:VOC family protein [Paenibacillus kobensis]|uniref:VOC family protein n=1 Tax=Paenibacillus kobensis TaxID=59841 RepID=UPI000FDB2DBE|nr:VOC family protein [Paenibacillus kobensis]
MTLSSTKIVKVIVVTDNLEKTASAYKALLGTGKEPAGLHAEHKAVRTPFTKYKGADITDTPMKVESVFSDNFWFEIIQPLGDNDPWAAWLKEHGTSICSICLLSDGPLENDEETMKNAGFESLFKQEKGYEAYEYFDTSSVLGVLVEVKEQYK